MLGPPRHPEERTSLADFTLFVTQQLGLVVAALAVVILGLIVIVLLQVRRVSRLEARIGTLTAGGDGRSLEATLDAHIDKVFTVAREVDELENRTAVLGREQLLAFQRHGLVRYNPFEDTGGNQSFALALLDVNGDGFVVSSLHSRAVTRVYAKAIAKGKSEAALSEEEAEALRKALASGTGSARG